MWPACVWARNNQHNLPCLRDTSAECSEKEAGQAFTNKVCKITTVPLHWRHPLWRTVLFSILTRQIVLASLWVPDWPSCPVLLHCSFGLKRPRQRLLHFNWEEEWSEDVKHLMNKR